MGEGSDRATFRHAIHDRDVHSDAKSGPRLLRLPVLGDSLVARRDVKAESRAQALKVQSAFLELNRRTQNILADVIEELKSPQP